MSIFLSPEIRQALAAHPGEPLELLDEISRNRYVLLPGETFDRLKALAVDNQFDIRDTYEAQQSALAAAGWDDPELDIYND